LSGDYQLICSICKKEMSFSEGVVEIDGKRCHESCKQQMYKQWKKGQGLDHF